MSRYILVLVLCSLAYCHSVRLMNSMTFRVQKSSELENSKRELNMNIVASQLPGDPTVTGIFSLGVLNLISIYSNIIFARVALSWFPQLPQQFPILRPIFTVTEPYLRVFRQAIPTIGGFDVSVIPATFALNILSQTAAAVGAELPNDWNNENSVIRKKLKLIESRNKVRVAESKLQRIV